MAPPVQACSSFQKQRCKADMAVQKFQSQYYLLKGLLRTPEYGLGLEDDRIRLQVQVTRVATLLTRSAKLNGKVVIAIFP